MTDVSPITDERLAEIREDAQTCLECGILFDWFPADILALLSRLDKAEAGWQVNVHYRIRFPAKAGTYHEFYSSNNGTSQWSDIAKVKAIITRGQPKGYKGRILEPFVDYEIIEVTERVKSSSRPLPPPPSSES